MFKTLKKLVSATPLIGAIYLGCSPRFGERLYHPQLFEQLPSADGDYSHDIFKNVTYRDVFFPSKNGKKLHGLFFPVDGGRKTILINHGNKGNLFDLDRLLELLLATGNSVFVYDYQGFGRSEGSPSVRAICEDGIAAFDWLINEGKVLPQDLVIYGESLGAAVSCHVAKHREVAGLILQAPFTNIREIAIESIPALRIYPSWLFPKPFLNNEAVLAEFRKPVLLLHGVQDKDVGVEHSRKLLEIAVGPKALIELPNTSHEEIAKEDSEVFNKALKAFFTKLGTREPVSVS